MCGYISTPGILDPNANTKIAAVVGGFCLTFVRSPKLRRHYFPQVLFDLNHIRK